MEPFSWLKVLADNMETVFISVSKYLPIHPLVNYLNVSCLNYNMSSKI